MASEINKQAYSCTSFLRWQSDPQLFLISDVDGYGRRNVNEIEDNYPLYEGKAITKYIARLIISRISVQK